MRGAFHGWSSSVESLCGAKTLSNLRHNAEGKARHKLGAAANRRKNAVSKLLTGTTAVIIFLCNR